jgi:hypothetical protein
MYLYNVTPSLVRPYGIVLLLLPPTPLKDKLLLMCEDSLSQLAHTSYKHHPKPRVHQLTTSTNLQMCLSHQRVSLTSARLDVYKVRPTIYTALGIRPKLQTTTRNIYTTLLGIRPFYRNTTHYIHTTQPFFCHPPERKYTMPELKRLPPSDLATNHAPCLLDTTRLHPGAQIINVERTLYYKTGNL